MEQCYYERNERNNLRDSSQSQVSAHDFTTYSLPIVVLRSLISTYTHSFIYILSRILYYMLYILSPSVGTSIGIISTPDPAGTCSRIACFHLGDVAWDAGLSRILFGVVNGGHTHSYLRIILRGMLLLIPGGLLWIGIETDTHIHPWFVFAWSLWPIWGRVRWVWGVLLIVGIF